MRIASLLAPLRADGVSYIHMNTSYLDWAATAPPYEDILKESTEHAIREFGNPSSAHAAGRAARTILDNSRARLAEALACLPERIVFTSGGSEADTIVLLSVLNSRGPRSIVISAIEHSAIHEQATALESLGVEVIRVKPERTGLVSPESVAEALRPDTVLVSIMAVNNETGAIQPLAEISTAVRSAMARKPPLLHTDAVQALGKIAFNPSAIGFDAASFSAHKLGGPRGVGALYLARSIEVLARGGGQENGIRAGTHNVAGAWCFSKAASRSVEKLEKNRDLALDLEKRLIEGIDDIQGASVIPWERKTGSPEYSPFITSIAFPGLGGETMARILDDKGIQVSTGAACSHARKDRRILDAMGLERELSFSAIRVSTGRETRPADIDRFLEAASAAYLHYRT